MHWIICKPKNKCLEKSIFPEFTFEKIVKLLKLVFQQSEANQEYGFSDFIAGRIDAHRKHGWMLRASAKV